MKDENRYWLVTTGPEAEPGINGGIVFRRSPGEPADGQPINAFVCTISVANLDKSIDNVLGSGGSIIIPRMAVQGIGWWANCRDTEGNIFGANARHLADTGTRAEALTPAGSPGPPRCQCR